jgi:hypothetical protein
MSLQFELILSKDRNVDILMITSLPAKEQIDGPTACYKPGSLE